MSDRGPYGQDPDPTEVFPPLPGEPTGPPSPALPPIGTERDPDPTRVMVPPPGGVPSAVTPLTGGPYDPGPPYGGDPGGPGGGGPGGPGGPGEPPFEPEPDPWYRQPGPLAALIAGVAALLVALIALLIWASSGGDDDNSDETLPTVASTTTTTTTSTMPASSTSTTIEPATTTSSTTTSSTTTTSTSTTTTTAVPETTTTAPPTTTTLPPTTTTLPPTTTTTTTTIPPTTPVPPGQGLLDEIRSDPDLSTFASALSCTGLDQDVLDGAIRTLLAPTDAVFDAAGLADPCGTDDGQTFEPVLLLHLVSVDLDAQQVFGADQLQTLGGRVPVNRTSQTIGSNHASIDTSTKAGDGHVHTVDAIIQQ